MFEEEVDHAAEVGAPLPQELADLIGKAQVIPPGTNMSELVVASIAIRKAYPIIRDYLKATGAA